MLSDQEFWEQAAIPASRMLLQLALSRAEVTRAVAERGVTVAEFSAGLAADLADRLLLERNKRMGLEQDPQ